MDRDLGTATAYTPPQTQQTTLPDTLTIQGRNFSVSHLLNLENGGIDFSDPTSLDVHHQQQHQQHQQQQQHQHHAVSGGATGATHHHHVSPLSSRDVSDAGQDDGKSHVGVISS